MQPSAPAAPTLPDLSDTRIAFAHKSDHELWKAQQLFRIIGNPTITAVGSGLTKAALALHLPIKGMVKATIFQQFCGGETIEESLASAKKLAQSGIGTILDHSVEGADDEDALDHTVAEVLRTIAVAKGRKEIPFCVFKPTGIARVELLEKVSAKATLSAAEQAEWQRAQQRMERICAAAAEAHVPTLIDAEESWIQDAIDHLAERMMERYNRDRALIYSTVQLYRYDRLDFLKRSAELARSKGYHLGMKLVRGAYMEKERERAAEKGYTDPIQPDKTASDRDYDAALRYCVEHIGTVSIVAGTHNEQSSLLLARLMNERGIAHEDPRICFSQLLGMSDNISYNLAAAGYRVAKYVPYGPVREVLPYLIRRANENTSAAGQTGRELGLILAEQKRRKKK
ncbi:MAG: proline dehydrogenase family protein [Flavobacteriales bacterium]|nr:proline dehydrogenase family protein [Flavobacteriales bacterium]MBL0036713.1 proline dehydrogenase family protein [Flavobacteriales bacterium]